jgi:hypothetical protein
MSRRVWLRSSTSVLRLQPIRFLQAPVASAGWKHNASSLRRHRTNLLLIPGLHVNHLVSPSNKESLRHYLLRDVLLQLLHRTLNSHRPGPILRLFVVHCRSVAVEALCQCGDSVSRRSSIAQSWGHLQVLVCAMRDYVVPVYDKKPTPDSRLQPHHLATHQAHLAVPAAAAYLHMRTGKI